MNNAVGCREAIGDLPRNWERAFGYAGDARQVAFYWEPADDAAIYVDGHLVGAGNWDLFLLLAEETFPDLQAVNLGSSQAEAEHWLVLDRETRRLEVLARDKAEQQMASQWPEPGEPKPAQWKTGFVSILNHFFDQGQDGDREWMDTQFCPVCYNAGSPVPGWLPAEDGGFDRCEHCHGRGVILAVKAA